MVLLEASLANVSWQGINPPEAGGNPLVYVATTLATRAAWSPSPVALPGTLVSPSRWILAGEAQTPLKL